MCSWFLVHLYKMISFSIFFVFFNFDFFGGFFGGKRVKNSPNDKKLRLSCSISQEHTSWLSFAVHMCKTIISPGVFFTFFQILSFGVNSRVRGQEMAENDKWCLQHSTSQESYIIWLWFVAHMCIYCVVLVCYFFESVIRKIIFKFQIWFI